MYMTGPIASLQNIQNINKQDNKASQERLRSVALEFEATLTAAVLKEGLKASSEMNEDSESSKSASTYKEFAFEQMAYYVGRQGIMGIADDIMKAISVPNKGGIK